METQLERFAAGDAEFLVGGCAEAPARPAAIRGRVEVPGAACEEAVEFMAPPREGFPLLARPAPHATARAPRQWGGALRRLLDARLESAGAVLVRGLPLRTPADFSELFVALGLEPVAYHGYTTRREVAPGVFTANVRDPGKAIDLHNDMAQDPVMPGHLFLFCVEPPPPDAGGETSIARGADWRRALGAELFERFERRGLERRTLSPARGGSRHRSRPWQERYGSVDAAAVEAACRAQGDAVAWLPDGSLATRRRMDAVIRRPGETLWCCTPQSDGTSAAYEVRYGDGERIEPELLERLRALQWSLSVALAWRRGDVLCLDNVGCQHGRLPLAPGAKRELLVSLATPRPGTCQPPEGSGCRTA